ncbi:MAG: SDR family NAD(P)-dependent oxidoreductase, partial [Bacteroidetes bacterium]|nr:SDR family NAD(P)-dependent oxidoreductase [Bacteroidota bacterium]
VPVNEIVVVDIKSLLLKIVSDKTGYPPDMLDLDADMEADLSIDSIKRMEIIASLKTQLGGGGGEEDMTERLAGVKSLQGLLNLIGGMKGAGSGPVEEAKKIIEEGWVREEKLVRIRFEYESCGVERNGTIAGHRLAVVGDGGELKKLLEEQGAVVVETLEDCDGLILLDTPILEGVAMVKQLGKVQWVYAVSTSSQGYSGFMKSLDKEWEHTLCRAIHLDGELSVREIAALVVDELSITERQPEVYYQEGSRKVMRMMPSELAVGQQAGVNLESSSVILVLGGAQGITAELMIGLSREYPCRYVLVGRSSDPRMEQDLSDGHVLSKEVLREVLIGRGQLKSPAEIERKVDDIYKRNQILHTITSLEKNGATVDYYSLDCRDEEKLGLLIGDLYDRYGRIDGVVHGAGLLEDKLFRQKTVESFERVFATKVNPLRVLMARLRPDVQFIALFSSVASVYGNRGQTDYAAANSVLDGYARQMKGRVVAINWGPWKGAGMVSPALEREYERRGISLIPLAAGMEAFLNELKYGTESQVLIMAGQTF